MRNSESQATFFFFHMVKLAAQASISYEVKYNHRVRKRQLIELRKCLKIGGMRPDHLNDNVGATSAGEKSICIPARKIGLNIGAVIKGNTSVGLSKPPIFVSMASGKK